MVEEGGPGTARAEEGEVEFREVLNREGWRCCGEVGEYDEAREFGECDFGGAEEGKGWRGEVGAVRADYADAMNG